MMWCDEYYYLCDFWLCFFCQPSHARQSRNTGLHFSSLRNGQANRFCNVPTETDGSRTVAWTGLVTALVEPFVSTRPCGGILVPLLLCAAMPQLVLLQAAACMAAYSVVDLSRTLMPSEWRRHASCTPGTRRNSSLSCSFSTSSGHCVCTKKLHDAVLKRRVTGYRP